MLLIDNSNTRTKFAIASEKGELTSWRTIVPSAELTPESLQQALKDSPPFHKVVICSVVPKLREMMARELQGYPTHLISSESSLPISINYPKPSQIGADRLANAVAAHALVGAPSIIIDFGTAVTFDVIDTTPAYIGGVIAPGLASLSDYLSRKTALLPHIELHEPQSAIGKSTEDAMQIGAVIGYRGLIREILKEISSEMSTKATIAATGGDAALIASKMPEISKVLPNLTLEGISLIGLQN